MTHKYILHSKLIGRTDASHLSAPALSPIPSLFFRNPRLLSIDTVCTYRIEGSTCRYRYCCVCRDNSRCQGPVGTNVYPLFYSTLHRKQCLRAHSHSRPDHTCLSLHLPQHQRISVDCCSVRQRNSKPVDDHWRTSTYLEHHHILRDAHGFFLPPVSTFYSLRACGCRLKSRCVDHRLKNDFHDCSSASSSSSSCALSAASRSTPQF